MKYYVIDNIGYEREIFTDEDEAIRHVTTHDNHYEFRIEVKDDEGRIRELITFGKELEDIKRHPKELSPEDFQRELEKGRQIWDF